MTSRNGMTGASRRIVSLVFAFAADPQNVRPEALLRSFGRRRRLSTAVSRGPDRHRHARLFDVRRRGLLADAEYARDGPEQPARRMLIAIGRRFGPAREIFVVDHRLMLNLAVARHHLDVFTPFGRQLARHA